jgi:hypothetical protein
MNKFCHLLSLYALKVLVSFFVCVSEGVKYNSLSILRIDYKANPVGHDALLAPFTQHRFEMLKYDK